jgi:hypothetical protein
LPCCLSIHERERPEGLAFTHFFLSLFFSPPVLKKDLKLQNKELDIAKQVLFQCPHMETKAIL